MDLRRPAVPVVALQVGHEGGEDLERGEGDALGAVGVREHGRWLHQIEDVIKALTSAGPDGDRIGRQHRQVAGADIADLNRLSITPGRHRHHDQGVAVANHHRAATIERAAVKLRR